MSVVAPASSSSCDDVHLQIQSTLRRVVSSTAYTSLATPIGALEFRTKLNLLRVVLQKIVELETIAVTPFSPGNESSVRASIERLANRLSADVQYLSAAYPCLGLRIPCAVGTPMPTATLRLVQIDSLLTSCEVARSSLTPHT